MGTTHVFSENPVLADAWYAVARTGDVAPGPLAVRLLGRPYVLWRDPDGAVTASADRCPHREAPLSAGTVLDGRLRCCYHGWQFGTGGRCVLVPSAQPGVPIPPRAHLDPVGVQERYGLVWICPGVPRQDIPKVPQEDDPSFRRLNPDVQVWRTSATRMVDNFLDITHFPFVHAATIGGATEEVVPKLELEQLDESFFGYGYDVTVSNPDIASATSGKLGGVMSRQMTTGFAMPFACRSTIAYETGLEHILLLLSTPIDDVTSYFIFVVWRNDDFSVPSDEVLRFDLAIGAEDKAMLERLDGVLPLDLAGTVSVQSDKPSVEWRRRFAALLGGN
ncbi:MAG: aromatic ring-hydroxylating dioxygenase subunit alpha [Acidimicrobiia bacterium]|nr:aromatic ring-hydroxylating dioxygenase subunit alpha [Acidimicrobiia bacterium]